MVAHILRPLDSACKLLRAWIRWEDLREPDLSFVGICAIVVFVMAFFWKIRMNRVSASVACVYVRLCHHRCRHHQLVSELHAKQPDNQRIPDRAAPVLLFQ